MSTEFLIPKFMDEPLFVHDSASEIDIIRKIHLFLQKILHQGGGLRLS